MTGWRTGGATATTVTLGLMVTGVGWCRIRGSATLVGRVTGSCVTRRLGLLLAGSRRRLSWLLRCGADDESVGL